MDLWCLRLQRAASHDDGGVDQVNAGSAATRNNDTLRKPGQIDRASLQAEDRLHEVSEAKHRLGVGQAARQGRRKAFEELDYQRAQLRIIRRVQPLYGLPPEEQKDRELFHPQVDAVVYRFNVGRASQRIADAMQGLRSKQVGDGYSGNAAAADKVSADIRIWGCWAHVTRRFREAEEQAPGPAKLFGDEIRHICEVGREADEAKLEPEGRVELRRKKSWR